MWVSFRRNLFSNFVAHPLIVFFVLGNWNRAIETTEGSLKNSRCGLKTGNWLMGMWWRFDPFASRRVCRDGHGPYLHAHRAFVNPRRRRTHASENTENQLIDIRIVEVKAPGKTETQWKTMKQTHTCIIYIYIYDMYIGMFAICNHCVCLFFFLGRFAFMGWCQEAYVLKEGTCEACAPNCKNCTQSGPEERLLTGNPACNFIPKAPWSHTELHHGRLQHHFWPLQPRVQIE